MSDEMNTNEISVTSATPSAETTDNRNAAAEILGIEAQTTERELTSVESIIAKYIYSMFTNDDVDNMMSQGEPVVVECSDAMIIGTAIQINERLTDMTRSIIEGVRKVAYDEGLKAGRAENTRGAHAARKLTDDLVVKVRDWHRGGYSYNKIAMKLLLEHNVEITPDACRSAIKGETYKNVK